MRFPLICEALVSPLYSDQAPIPLQILDVSTTGIGLLSAHRYESGTALFIQVQEEGPDCSRRCRDPQN